MAQPAHPVEWILQQSHRYPLLTAEEEIILARQVQAWLALAEVERPTKRQRAIITKGKRARDRFYLSNIRLAVKIAGKYKKFAGTLTMEDLIQEGLLGLDSAITKFDPSLGYKFSTYCYWWIRQGITRAINRDSRIIHLPMQANDVIRKAYDFMQEHLRTTGKLPTMQKLCEHCCVTEEYLINYLSHSNGVLSLDHKVQNNEDLSSLLDFVADPNGGGNHLNELECFNSMLDNAIDQLPPIQQEIIVRRFLTGDTKPESFENIGKSLQLTRQATQQQSNRALRSLRLKLGGQTGQECIQVLQCAA